MMFRSLVQCFHYFIFIADSEWGSAYEFFSFLCVQCDLIRFYPIDAMDSSMWFHGYQNIDSDQSRYDWVSRYGPSSSSSSFVKPFFSIDDWCVIFPPSIHSMWFPSVCAFDMQIRSIQSINFHIFDSKMCAHRMCWKWCEYQSTMEIFGTKKVLFINLTKLTHYGWRCVFVMITRKKYRNYNEDLVPLIW